MATKKAGSAAKKTVKKSPAPSKPTTTTTKVTTVKAIETASPVKSTRLTSNRTFIASALIAEFIGTFLLTAVVMGTRGEPLYVAFSLVAIVLTVGAISGAHVNPLLTVGAWVTRKMTTLRALGYIVAQVLGAAFALVVLTLFIGAAPAPDASSAMMGQAQTPELFKVAALTDKSHWYVFFAELVGATIFAFAVANARRITERSARALTVGLGLLVAVLFAVTAAGYASANAIVNPAVALAIGGVADWAKIDWVAFAAYFIAPLIGGVLGFALQDVLHAGQNRKDV